MAQYDPFTSPPGFDLSREFILTYPTPTVRVGRVDDISMSTTMSTYRLHWNDIRVWEDFGNEVHQYWNHTMPQHDKPVNVMNQAIYSEIVRVLSTRAASAITNEGRVRQSIDAFVVTAHDYTASGRDDAPRPNDYHSLLYSLQAGPEVRHLSGIPDFVMRSEVGNQRITVVVEAKNPWQVTPAKVDAVIASILI
jgi:hypothetical protein